MALDSLVIMLDGIWAQIGDGEDLGESMGAYYKFFAYGLSQDEDFVAWVEPYEFATGVGKSSYYFSRISKHRYMKKIRKY